MVDTTATAADVAKLLCDKLCADGKLKVKPAFIREDREAKLAGIFDAAGIDGAKLLGYTNPRELEVDVRNATQGEGWVDDVFAGLKGMMTADAGAAAPVMVRNEEVANAMKVVAERRASGALDNPEGREGGGGGSQGFDGAGGAPGGGQGGGYDQQQQGPPQGGASLLPDALRPKRPLAPRSPAAADNRPPSPLFLSVWLVAAQAEVPYGLLRSLMLSVLPRFCEVTC